MNIRRVAVLGAGVMGAQIAAHLVNAGVETLLFELPSTGGDKNNNVIKALDGLKKLDPSPLASPAKLTFIQPANYEQHLGLLRECDLVIEAIAERLDVSEKDVIEMERRLASADASLDAPLNSGGDDDGSRTRLDYLPSEGGRPDQEVEENEFSTMLKNKLEEFASGLEGREQTIFRERWLTESPQTLQEIGDKYGVSRERARQLEKSLLGRLRKFLETELGTEIDIAAMAHG